MCGTGQRGWLSTFRNQSLVPGTTSLGNGGWLEVHSWCLINVLKVLPAKYIHINVRNRSQGDVPVYLGNDQMRESP